MAQQTDSTRKPPQALDAETAVLGAMLLDTEAVPRVMEALGTDPVHFYLQSHRRVYEAIVNLYNQSKPSDVVSVAGELKRLKEFESVGGMEFLSGLLDSVLTTAHCAEHAKMVLEKSIQRQLIETATEIVQLGYDESSVVQELLDQAEQKIFSIRQAGTRKGFVEIKPLLHLEMERFEAAREHHRLVTGVETGFHQLDELTSGFQPGEFIIIAGRPSMGKTALALNVAVNTATRNRTPVAIFSLEMSDESLTGRILCSTAGVSMKKVRRGMITDREKHQLTAALGPLSEAPIFIDDSAGLNALEIRARARRKKSESGIGLVIIDYLQLMEAHGAGRRDRNRQQEISEISRALKAMAKELNVPVVALSQLSRQPESRPDKRPQLSDLRESGAIEQDADLVLLLYRAKFYAREGDEANDTAEVIIAKQRNGPLGVVKLTFLDECMRFENPFLHGPSGPVEEESPEEAGEEDDYLPA